MFSTEASGKFQALCAEIFDGVLMFLQGYYFLTFVLTILSAVAMSAVFARTTLAASSGLHNQVFRSVLSTTMSFFDTTPAGRILNR